MVKINEKAFNKRFDSFYSFYALSTEFPMNREDAYKMMRAGYEAGMSDMLKIFSGKIAQRSHKA